MSAFEAAPLRPAAPLPALQYQTGGHQEERHDAEEVDHIARINHAAADALVVVPYAEALHEEVGVAQDAHVVQALEAQVGNGTEQGCKDKRHNLVVGQRRAEEANGHEGATQQEQSDVGTDDAARVDVAHRVAKGIDADVAYQRRQQRDEYQSPRSQKLGKDDGPVAQRTSHEHLDGAGTFLFGQRAHGDGGDEEEVEERADEEEAVHAGIAVVEDVEVAFQHPQHQSGEHQEYRYRQIADERREEVGEFFFIQ